MNRCCPPPAAPPSKYVWNCECSHTRFCADGSGITPPIVIPAAYFALLIADYSSEAAAQLEANEIACRLARRRSLQEVLICNTLTPSDLADCGEVEERPVFSPACALVYCNGAGLPYCDGDDVEYTSITPLV